VCGAFVTLAAPQIFAGWLECPACNEFGVCVPETILTPRMQAYDIVEDYQIIHVQESK